MDYAHLGLTDWPFTTVPSERFSTFMADRKVLRVELETLARNLSRRRPSSMHLLWAWFGAGKTHSLYYLTHLAAGHANLLAIYTEFPKAPKTFADVVRQLARSLPLKQLETQYLQVATNPHRGDDHDDELGRAVATYVTGTADRRNLAARWLRGEELRAPELRQLDLSRYLRDSDDAIRFISQLVALLGNPLAEGNARLVWMIDEFQRIEDLVPGVRDQLLSSLHSAFNACPDDLTVILSFSGKPEPKLPEWLTPELRDRIGLEPTMLLPPMTRAESIVFLGDVLANFRLRFDPTCEHFPFEEQALERVVAAAERGGELKPRALMQYANAVLETADVPMQAGQLTRITPAFVDDALKSRQSLMDRDE